MIRKVKGEAMRYLRHAYWRLLIMASLCVLSLLGCRREPHHAASGSGDVVAVTTLLATMPVANNQVADSAVGGDHAASSRVVIQDKGRGYAFVAESGGTGHVVHNGTAHQPFAEIDHLTLSQDGQHVAYSYRNGKRCIVLDGRAGTFYDDVWQPVFSPDNRHIAYIAQEKEQSHIVTAQKMSAGSLSYTGNPVFSSDSSKIAYVESAAASKNARLVVTDLELKPLLTRDCTNHELVLNADKSRIAAVEIVNGKQRLIVVDFLKPDQSVDGPLYDAVQKLVFDTDGVSVAYAAQRGPARYLVFKGTEQRLPNDAEIEALAIHPDQKGVGAIIASQEKYYLFEAFVSSPSTEKKYSEATGIVYSRDGRHHAYAAAQGKDVFAVIDGKEGPVFDMIVKPQFSPDGSSVVYRARKDGKRFVVVSDLNGKVIRQHAAYEQVFPPVFTADGKSVAYGVKDGNQLIWKVEKL